MLTLELRLHYAVVHLKLEAVSQNNEIITETLISQKLLQLSIPALTEQMLENGGVSGNASKKLLTVPLYLLVCLVKSYCMLLFEHYSNILELFLH